MRISDQQQTEFAQEGWTRIPAALPGELVRASDRCVLRAYDTGPQHDGIMGLPDLPGLDALLTDPHLEAIAEQILGCPVILNSSAILFKQPQPGEPFKLQREHVDVMYSLDEWNSRPRRVMCMLMVLLADLPEGRGNTCSWPNGCSATARIRSRPSRPTWTSSPRSPGAIP